MADTNQLLKRLGLNQYESKVYLALLTKGLSSAGDVSGIADVPRSRVYDVLTTLEKKGFATIQQDRPVKYMPVEPKEVLRRIKDGYKTDYGQKVDDLEKLEENILKSLVPIYEEAYSQVDVSNLSSFVKGRDNLKRQMEQMMLSAESSISKLTTSGGIVRLKENHTEHMEQAKKKGVKIRVLTHLSGKHKAHAQKLPAEVRHLEGIDGRILLKDNKEALLIMSPETEQNEFGVWVKSPYLAKNLQGLYDHLWEHGQKV